MTFARRIGAWSMTALVVNAIIGAAPFGVPSELLKVLGSASTLGVVLGGVATAIVIACFAEVASKFTEPGGAYIYARTVFGRFAGVQVGWFSWLTRMSSAAASATIFISYLGGLVPSLEFGAGRLAVLTAVLGMLALANYVGVRSGANVSSVVAVAKVAPLLVIGIYAVMHGSWSSSIPQAREVAEPGLRNWFEAFLIMSFMYGGCDTAMMPLGEVKEPRRTVPLGLAGGLLVCIVVFTVVQMAVVATAGVETSTRPLAQVASVYFGAAGAVLVSVAAMISTYGHLSANTLSVPRLTYALAEQGDFPRFFARMHPRFQTPHVSVIIFALLVWVIAATGTFRFAVALSVGARLITYLSTCAAVIPLRRNHPQRKGFEVPFAPALSIVACVMSLALITRVHQREAIALGITMLVATASWWFTRNKAQKREPVETTVRVSGR